MLNSLTAGRRLALRLLLGQLGAALVLGLIFAAMGPREAIAAAAGALSAAAGTALLSVRIFGQVSGAGMALARLFTGMFLKWMATMGGMITIIFLWKLPPLAAIAGLAAAYAMNLKAFRFKD